MFECLVACVSWVLQSAGAASWYTQVEQAVGIADTQQNKKVAVDRA